MKRKQFGDAGLDVVSGLLIAVAFILFLTVVGPNFIYVMVGSNSETVAVEPEPAPALPAEPFNWEPVIQTSLAILFVIGVLAAAIIGAIFAVRAMYKLNQKNKSKEASLAALKLEQQKSIDAVESVKAQIGSLRSDIVWVIENPAFFDDNSAITMGLFASLSSFDEAVRKSNMDEVVSMSPQIVESFEQSKLKAEKLGFDYLDASSRKSMVTASQLARKALATPHKHEAETYMSKVADILANTLAVTLPVQTMKEIEVYTRKALTAA